MLVRSTGYNTGAQENKDAALSLLQVSKRTLIIDRLACPDLRKLLFF